MRIFAILLLLAALPQAAAAQVTVRTGEHPNFSRVVLAIPVGTDWRVGRVENGYGIVLEGVSDIDLTNFFERIPRTRIQDATQVAGEGRINMRVNCLCDIDAFLWRPDRLVVDIRDGIADPNSSFEAALFPLLPEVIPSPVVAVPIATEFAAAVPASPDIAEAIALPTFLDPFASLAGQTAEVIALEESVVSNLERATAQGLLTPSGRPEETSESARDQERQPVVEEAIIDIEIDPISDDPPSPGIRIQTSIDRDRPPGLSELSTQAGLNCWPDAFVDVPAWGDNRSFADQISELRVAVTQEFDATDPKDVEALARAYLHFGFGREAAQTLAIDGSMSPERLALISLAQIMDGDRVNPAIPSDQMSCDRPVALWAFLGEAERDLTVNVNRNAVLRAFRALPLRLQSHLGPRLADRFLAIGDIDAAEAALSNRVHQADQSVDMAIAEIKLQAERGDDDEVLEELTTLAETDGRMTPEALLGLLSLNQINDTPLDESLLSLAAALRFENRGTQIADDLAVAEFESWLKANEFGRAENLLKSIVSGLPAETASMLQNRFASALSDRSPDRLFLDFAFDETTFPLSPENQNMVAARLLSLGFPERAKDFLDGPAVGAPMAERRYLRAAAAVELEDYENVDAILAGVSSLRANVLRGLVAARQSGYLLPLPEAVLDEQAVTESTDNAVLQDWRQGNWDQLTTIDDALLRTATSLVLTENATPPDPVAPLAQGADLLAQSEELRSVVDELMGRFSSPQLLSEATN